MFVCGYCGKRYEDLAERCKCEVACSKRREEEEKQKKQEELSKAKKDRDNEIVELAKCLKEKMRSFYSDYHERCSIECQPRRELISDYIEMIDPFRGLWLI